MMGEILIDSYSLQACFRLDSTSEDGRELLVPSGEKTNYFEKGSQCFCRARQSLIIMPMLRFASMHRPVNGRGSMSGRSDTCSRATMTESLAR